jgi:tRNA G18 (ribose-2'-O)-methylase SpoU
MNEDRLLIRNSTRRQRYAEKASRARYLPVSFCTVNFMFDENVAYLTRAAACFGVQNIYVIGELPNYDVLRSHSGSTNSFVSYKKFSNPSSFLEFSRSRDCNLLAAELSESAVSLHDYSFDFQKETIIVLGQETTGVPVEILMNAKHVMIPMNGAGFCLNTSFAGTVMLYEAAKQFAQNN